MEASEGKYVKFCYLQQTKRQYKSLLRYLESLQGKLSQTEYEDCRKIILDISNECSRDFSEQIDKYIEVSSKG